MEPQQRANDRQQSANEIFAQAVEEKRERDRLSAERARAPSVNRERATLAGLLACFPILIVVIAINVVGLSLTALFESEPSPSAARQEAQRTIDTLVADIKDFAKDYDQLPESLVEIGVPSRGEWQYAITGARSFRVHGTLYGQTVSFAGEAPTAAEPEQDPEYDQ